MSFHTPARIRASTFVHLVWWLGLVAWGLGGFEPRAAAQSLLSINDPTVLEGDTGTNQLVFTLTLSEPAAVPVTIDFYTIGATATPGIDFAPTNGTVTFNPGETNLFLAVDVFGDQLNEPDETVWLALTNVSNALLIDNRGDGIIFNDDPLPALSLSGTAVTEPDTGFTNAVFGVTLSAPSGQSVVVQFTTISGTALAGLDFSPQADSVVIPPGETNTTIVVPVFGDLIDENDEQFSVAITNASNASLPALPASGTILDNDPLPQLNIGDITLLEGTGGTTPASFPLQLSTPSGRPLSVDFQTLNGTATGGADFTATNGTVVFPAGITNLAITISVTADANIETTENFSLRLSNPTNVILIRTQALATILDDETRTLTFTNAAPITAALSGAADPYPSQIELSGLVGTVTKVTATLVGVTHSFPDDYDILLVGPQGQNVMLMSDCGGGNAINNLTLTFDDAAASELPDAGTITAGTFRPSDYVASDVLVGPAPSGSYGDALGIFRGVNPNGTWSLFVYDDSAGGAGALNGGWRLSVTLSNLVCCTGGTADLSVTVTDSPDPVTTTSNLTYTARIINNGPAGATSTTFTNFLPPGVNLLGATTTQGTLNTNASQISGNLGTLGLGAQAIVTFIVSPTTFGTKTNLMIVQSDKTDPDPANNTAITPTVISQLAPLLRVADATIAEGDWGNTNLLFAVTLSRTNATPVTAGFTTIAGTATANSDYLTTADTVTFAPGVTNVFIAVPVIGDINVESTETFTVQITSITNALLADGTGLGIIANDDGLPLHVQSFSWSAIGTTQYVGVPIPVTITARDISNNVATTFTGPARLAAVTGSGPDVSLLITEIDTDANDAVEISNVSGSAVDLSGWQVTFYDWLNWPAPAATFVVPANTVCAANQVFTITDNGTAPGTYPSFSLGQNLFWTKDDSTNMVAVLLRDADGRTVDFVCAVDANPADISTPIFIPASQWTGSPIPANTNSTLTYRRSGGSDTQQAANFTTGSPNLGIMNAELTLPFTGTRALATSPTLALNFSNGVWSGIVSVNEATASAALRANDVPGHMGVSTSFTVLPSVDLAIGGVISSPAVASGQPILITLNATNIGNTTGNAVFLTNTLPPSFSFTAATTTQGSFTASSNLVTFNLGTMSPGARATATIQAIPTVGGIFTNIARIAASLPDGVATNNSSALSVFVNTPPTFTPVGTQLLGEGSTLIVTNLVTDPDQPANTLTYSLLTAPAGATLVSNVFTWSTTELDGGSTNFVMIQVQDNSTPNLGATQAFTVVVAEINTQPQFLPTSTQYVLEGSLKLVNLSAMDTDLPANQLTFSLLNAPPGAALSTDGVFSWAPTEAQGPGTYTIVARVQDNGIPSLSSTQSWDIIVWEYNSPPAVAYTPDQVVTAGQTLTVTNLASDPDIPTNTLTFSLVSGPSGANQAGDGIFTWTPSLTQTGTHRITFRVADDGEPSLSVTQSFQVIVAPSNSANLRISSIKPNPGAVNLSFAGPPGYSYLVESRPLTGGNWSPLTQFATPASNSTVIARDAAAGQQKYYRIRNLTIPYQSPLLGARYVSNGVFNLTFTGQSGRSYAVETRTTLNSGSWNVLTNVILAASNLPLNYSGPGIAPSEFRVTRLSLPVPAQRIDRLARSGTNLTLQFTLPPGLPVTVERAPALTGPWSALTNLPAFASQTSLQLTDPIGAAPKFYRLNLNIPSAAVPLISQNATPPGMDLTFTTTAERSYTVQYREALGTGIWQTLTNLTALPLDTVRVISDPAANQPARFYRLQTP